jgi:hypothetical protein
MGKEKYFLVLLILLLAFATKKVYSQKLIIDTFTYTQYDVYCESVMVCEYLVPDSTFQRLNGKSPDEETEGILKYQKYCYNLGYDKDWKLYSFKDFELRLADKGIEFSYPQYSYFIYKDSLINTIKDITLYSHKTKELFKVKRLYLTIDTGLRKGFDLPVDKIELNNFLETIDKSSRMLKLQVEPIKYPIIQEDCGSILVEFPTIEFSLL